jgi:hypothetical protein
MKKVEPVLLQYCVRLVTQYIFGQAFTRDQVIAFAESLVEDTDVEVGLLNGKSMTHIADSGIGECRARRYQSGPTY